MSSSGHESAAVRRFEEEKLYYMHAKILCINDVIRYSPFENFNFWQHDLSDCFEFLKLLKIEISLNFFEMIIFKWKPEMTQKWLKGTKMFTRSWQPMTGRIFSPVLHDLGFLKRSERNLNGSKRVRDTIFVEFWYILVWVQWVWVQDSGFGLVQG